MKGIVIDLKSADTSTEKRIDSVIDKLADLNASLQNVQTNFRAAASAGGQFSNVRSRSSGGGRPRRTAAPPIDFRSVLADPNMRAQVLSGDPFAAQAYNKALSQQRGVARAQKAINPPPPPGFGQNAMSLLMRSRYGGGGSGGVMPLGMDVAKLFGGAGGAKGGGPIAIAAMAVIGTAKLVAAEFKMAARSAREYADALVAGGPGAGAVLLGGFTGTGPGGGAAAVRGRSGREAAFGTSRGISPLAGDPYFDPGGANKAYQKMAEAVAKAADAGGFGAAQKEASRLGAPELARLGMLSKETRDQLIATTKRESPAGATRAFADFWAQLSIFGKEFGDLIKTHMTPHVKAITKLLSYLNKFLAWLNDQLKVLFGWTGIFGSEENKVSDHDDALKEHTRAMREHSEFLGGDRRARESVPRAVQGNPAMWIDRDALRQSIRLGALV